MSLKTTADRIEPATRTLDFGTTSYFSRMTGADRDVSAYWVSTVHRPAHRIAHPLLSIDGCPGCVFETTVA